MELRSGTLTSCFLFLSNLSPKVGQNVVRLPPGRFRAGIFLFYKAPRWVKKLCVWPVSPSTPPKCNRVAVTISKMQPVAASTLPRSTPCRCLPLQDPPRIAVYPSKMLPLSPCRRLPLENPPRVAVYPLKIHPASLLLLQDAHCRRDFLVL